MLSRFSCVRLFAPLWTTAHQAPLSIGFSRQEYSMASGLPCPLQGGAWGSPNSGIEPVSPVSFALAGKFFSISATWETPRVTIGAVQFSRSVVYDSLRPHEW